MDKEYIRNMRKGIINIRETCLKLVEEKVNDLNDLNNKFSQLVENAEQMELDRVIRKELKILKGKKIQDEKTMETIREDLEKKIDDLSIENLSEKLRYY